MRLSRIITPQQFHNGYEKPEIHLGKKISPFTIGYFEYRYVQFQNVTLIMGGGFMLTSFAVQIQVAWASRFVGGLASVPELEGKKLYKKKPF